MAAGAVLFPSLPPPPGSILEIPGVAGISGREANELATRETLTRSTATRIHVATPPPSNPPCFARRFPVYARRRNIDFAELEHTREHGAIIRKLPLPSSVQSFPSPRSGQWMDNFEEKRLDSSFYNKIIR